MLLPRILTAVIGTPLILLSIYWGGIPHFILLSGVVLFSLREYFLIAKKASYNPHAIIGIICGYVFFLSIFLSSTSFSQEADHQLVPITITVILVVVFLCELLKKSPERVIERISVTFLGVFFIPWAFSHLARIYYLKPHGKEWTFFLFLLIWILDAAAYFFGMKFGKNRLVESVSPKKSVEGLVAAILSAAIAAPLLAWLLSLKNYLGFIESVIIGILIAAVSQFSDLSESLLKRDADIKDSDLLLPGHGGILDRFDSFLFTAPLFYYYIVFFK